MIAQDNPLLQEPYYRDARTTETERLTADVSVKAHARPFAGRWRVVAWQWAIVAAQTWCIVLAILYARRAVVQSNSYPLAIFAACGIAALIWATLGKRGAE
jgi:hypothetical protein